MADLLDKALVEGKTRTREVEEFVRGFEKVVNYKGASYYEIPTDPERYGLSDAEGLKRSEEQLPCPSFGQRWRVRR